MENINEVKIKTKNTITKLLTPENFDEVIKEYKSPIETENNNTSIIVDDVVGIGDEYGMIDIILMPFASDEKISAVKAFINTSLFIDYFTEFTLETNFDYKRKNRYMESPENIKDEVTGSVKKVLIDEWNFIPEMDYDYKAISIDVDNTNVVFMRFVYKEYEK